MRRQVGGCWGYRSPQDGQRSTRLRCIETAAGSSAAAKQGVDLSSGQGPPGARLFQQGGLLARRLQLPSQLGQLSNLGLVLLGGSSGNSHLARRCLLHLLLQALSLPPRVGQLSLQRRILRKQLLLICDGLLACCCLLRLLLQCSHLLLQALHLLLRLGQLRLQCCILGRHLLLTCAAGLARLSLG